MGVSRQSCMQEPPAYEVTYQSRYAPVIILGAWSRCNMVSAYQLATALVTWNAEDLLFMPLSHYGCHPAPGDTELWVIQLQTQWRRSLILNLQGPDLHLNIRYIQLTFPVTMSKSTVSVQCISKLSSLAQTQLSFQASHPRKICLYAK